MRETAPLWRYVDIRTSNVDKKSKDDEQPVRLVNYTDVYYNQRITPDLSLMVATASDEHIDRFGVRPGDLIITKDSESPDDIGVPALVTSSTPDMVCAYHLSLLRPDTSVAEPRFIYWLLESDHAKGYWLNNSFGVTRYSLLGGTIARLRVPIYGLDHQKRIADYLERETGEIDAMIAKLDELTESLETRRTAVIDRAFAHTLEAPTVAVHLMADVTVGIVIEPSKLYVPQGTGVPALRGLNIAPGRIVGENIVDISREGHMAHSKSELRTGDVVTVRTGRVGTTAVVTDEWDGSNAIDLVITRLHDGNDARFFYWYLASSVARAQIDNDSVGSVQSHFNVGALKRLRAPLVDSDEQKRIADHLDEVTARIDKMFAKVADLKTLLVERRSALITDVVTGRKDVA